MYKTYSGYHFFYNFKVNRTGLISSLRSYNDCTDVNDSDSKDIFDINKDKDEEDLNTVLNSLKDNIIENLKDYIKSELKTEIINEIKTEIINEIKTEILNDLKYESNIKKRSNETNNKTTRICCLCKIEKNRDCFYKTGGLCKGCCSQKVSCPICNIVINRSALNKHKERAHSNQSQISNNI